MSNTVNNIYTPVSLIVIFRWT